jgi:HEAT repeat protein
MKTALHVVTGVCFAVVINLPVLLPAGTEPTGEQGGQSEPLVFELVSHIRQRDYRQELLIRQGEPFRAVTRIDGLRWTVSGRAGTIQDDEITIDCTVEVHEGAECLVKTTEELRLPIDVFTGRRRTGHYRMGIEPGALLILDPWVRRSLDPVPIFIKDLQSEDERRVSLAVQCLSRLAPEAAAAAPALGKALRRYDAVEVNSDAERLAGRIAEALGEIGPPAKPAVEDLFQTLQGPSPYLQVKAGSALWRIDEDRKALERLVELVEHPTMWIRICAAEALGETRRGRHRSVPALIKALRDDEPHVRFRAALSLWDVSKHPAAIDILADALSWEDESDRRWAAKVLGEIGPPAKSAVDALAASLELEGDWPRRAAAEALGKMQTDSPAAIVALIRAWHDRHSGCQGEAVAALRRIGPAGAVPLAQLIGDENVDWKLRCQAADALGLLRANASTAVPDLIAALEHPNGNIRQRAAQALGRIGPPAKQAIPALSRAVDTEDLIPLYRGIVVRAAVEALGGIGPDGVEALRDALRHDNSYARRWAAITLGKLGPAASAAVPDLIDALHDDDEYVRLDASRALRRIGWTRP